MGRGLGSKRQESSILGSLAQGVYWDGPVWPLGFLWNLNPVPTQQILLDCGGDVPWPCSQ